MVKNFLAMPPLLKLFTAVTVVVPMFCVASMFQSIRVFGRPMAPSEWWASGAGLTTLVVGGLMLAAAFLMLRRSRYGRPVYILGGIVTSLSAPLIAYFIGVDLATEVPSLISNLVLTALIALYLYKSRAVQNYFAAEPVTSIRR